VKIHYIVEAGAPPGLVESNEKVSILGARGKPGPPGKRTGRD
jgi:hypothetical protein